MSKPFVQTYKYDSLYRITEAKEMNDTTQTWIQTYGYDKYGNRTAFSQNVHGQNLTIDNVTRPTVNANTNRFNTGQGYEYDKIGNLKKDVTKLNGVTESRDITFNGDNKQIEIKDTNTNKKIGEYFYDGSGKRVKKRLFDGNNQPLEDTIFVYSGDKLVAEYSTTPKTNPKIQYVATDTLGSVRAITDQYGQIVSRRDFMPFGEELQADANYRKANLKYNSDDVRQKFTGYQKDEETGLDFAEARMYNNSHARFTAVDPLLASGKSANPQTFNRYVYVMNNPIAYTDPTGLQAGTSMRELNFAARHPIAASAIGKASRLGTNISSVSTRFATNSDFNNARGLREVTEINALRHGILSAMIQVSFSKHISQHATGSHEDNTTLPSSEQDGSMFFDSEDTADKEADLRNNTIGRSVADSLGENATNKDVSKAVLKEFKTGGLYVLKKNKNGKIQVLKTKIGKTQYDNTLKDWARREEDTGFTANGRKQYEEQQKKIIEARRNGNCGNTCQE